MNFEQPSLDELLESLKENVDTNTEHIHDHTKIDLIVSPIGDLE